MLVSHLQPASQEGDTLVQQDFKMAMRQWQTGVCLVTTTAADGTPVGMVCNSFASISLDPPLVGWSVDHNSSSYEAWSSADSYAIHILPRRENPLDDPLVAQFAQRGGDKFAGLTFERDEHGDPVFPELDTRFDCVIHERITLGDHDLMVGRVTNITHP